MGLRELEKATVDLEERHNPFHIHIDSYIMGSIIHGLHVVHDHLQGLVVNNLASLLSSYIDTQTKSPLSLYRP